MPLCIESLAARLERSSFCRSAAEEKKAGVEGGNSCPKIDNDDYLNQ